MFFVRSAWLRRIRRYYCLVENPWYPRVFSLASMPFFGHTPCTMQHILTATPRTLIGKHAQKLSAEGLIPAVVYGASRESLAISISLRDIEAVLRHGGENTLVSLEGLDAPVQALIHDLDRDPVSHAPRHVDFLAVKKGERVTVAIPLEFVGESFAVKTGANLVKVLHEVEVEAEATNIPSEITVDVTSLAAIGDQIHVSALQTPKGVTITTSADEVVAIAQAVSEDTGEESTALDMSAIEVEKKGKSEEAE